MKYIDSSDDEAESVVINQVRSQGGIDALLKKMFNTDIINTSDKYKLYLGLTLHYLADRVFRNSEIDTAYKKIKTKQFSLSQEDYDIALNSIKDFLSMESTWTEDDKQMLVDINQLKKLVDKDYIQLFNHLFNSVISLPEWLVISDQYAKTYKSTLLEKFSKSSVNLDFIKKSGNALHLSQTEDSNSAAQVLSFSKITNRNNKNKIKFYNKLKIDKDVSSAYQFYQSVSDSFTENHQIHYKNKNTQTKIESITTYDEILKTLVKPNISESITTYIFNIIKNKESNVILSNEYKVYAEQLSHLIFITEMGRDKTTLFTAPMFLELIQKGEVNKKYFPTSMELAVPALRGVIKKFKELLPNTHTLDYDEENLNLKLADNLLIDMGNELIQWMKKVEMNKSLEEIALIFDFIYNNTIKIKNEGIATISDVSKIIQQYNYLKGLVYFENTPKIAHDLIESINSASDINSGILQECEEKSNRSGLLILKEKILTFNKSKSLPIGELESNILAFQQSNLLDESQKQKIQLIIKNVRNYVEVFFNLTKNMNEVIEDLNKKMPETLKISLELIIKTLSIKVKEWYSIDIDLVQLLKAAGEKKNQSDPDISHSKMLMEKSKIDPKELPDKYSTELFSMLGHKRGSAEKGVVHEIFCELIRAKKYAPENFFTVLEPIYNYMLDGKEKPVNTISSTIIDILNKSNSLSKYYEEKKKQLKDIFVQVENYELSGSGEYGEIKPIGYIDPYFGKYTLDALDEILHLRINGLQLKDVKILQSIFINQDYNNISDTLVQILSSTERTTLVPLNLFNKHAVGLIFEKNENGMIQVKYLDSLNKHIPQELKQLLTHTLGFQVDFQQVIVEQQKYANCGVEVIENFILHLTGKRASQEKAIELHSKLVENTLLGINSSEIHSLFEELTDNSHSTENYLEQNLFHNSDYVKSQQIELIGQDHHDTI